MKRLQLMAQKVTNGRVALGETTPVKLGLVVIILGLVFSVVWWAATMNAKLDILVSKIGVIETSNTDMKKQVDELKLWRAEIDRSGTRALESLRNEVSELRLEFRLHAAKNGTKP